MGLLLTELEVSELVNSLSIKPVLIAIGGSCVLPIIDKPHDIDYIFLFNINEDELKQVKAEIQAYRDKLLRETKHTIDELCFITKNFRTCWGNIPLSSQIMDNFIVPNAVFENYWKIIYGKHEFLYEILGKDKELFCKSLRKSYDIVYTRKKDVFLLKYWYYIYLACCVILNNSFTDFTEEQIKDINILHDLTHPKSYRQVLEKLAEMIKRI